MTVATDLQDITSDISAAIAGAKTYGRVELEQLRRRLAGIGRELRDDARAGVVSSVVLDELVGAIEREVADLSGVARRARAQMPQVAK